MCCCIALHMSTAGRLYERRLLVCRPHMPLPRCCWMMRVLLPYYEMTSWEGQRRQLLQGIHSCTLSLPLGTIAWSSLGDD